MREQVQNKMSQLHKVEAARVAAKAAWADVDSSVQSLTASESALRQSRSANPACGGLEEEVTGIL